MVERLPPLTALRAFDAAARHMSFAKAADELHVTPAALSYQIKALEEHLGSPLFRRLNRAVELTEAGKVLAPGIKDGFQTLTAAWRSTKRLQDNETLNVTAGPAFTAKWLAPRLFKFAQAHPEIELRFSASLRMMDFSRDGIDVAVRFGYGTDDGLFSMPLAEEWVAPVMTPELAMQFPTPESLAKAPLIIDHSVDFLDPPAGWSEWFAAMKVNIGEIHGVQFSQGDHAVDAALAGAGIVLGRRAFVVKEISEGRLVMPFKTALGTGARFRFLCTDGVEDQPKIKAFREWMIAEISKTADITAGLKIIPVGNRR